jgi:cytochrome c peroxidase
MKTWVICSCALIAVLGAVVVAATVVRRPAVQGPAQPVTSAATVSSKASGSGNAIAVNVERKVPERRESQALAYSEQEHVLYLADEDHGRLRRIVLVPELTNAPDTKEASSVQLQANERSLVLPGKPAHVLSLGDVLLVTIREPGLLLMVQAGENMKEIARVALPDDAWGMAVSPNGNSVYVTSAWSRKLSQVTIDGNSLKRGWSLDVRREPRGVAVTANGNNVYISHLIGSELTMVDVEQEPMAQTIDLPPDPLETLVTEILPASLGYAAILSPDGQRLFVARHALGAIWSWQGRTTVDILSTKTKASLLARRKGKPYGQFPAEALSSMKWTADFAGLRANADEVAWSQPRAMVYRKKTKHLLVASEGMAVLAELDAMSVSPGLITNRLYRLGGLIKDKLPKILYRKECGAPTAVTLSSDENVAWVYCRSTDNIVAVRLTPHGERATSTEISYVDGAQYHSRLSFWGPFAYAKLDTPAMDEELLVGRRLFYDGLDPVVSRHMGCAGCHPEGRDDGHVWREQHPTKSRMDKNQHYLAGPTLSFDPFDPPNRPHDEQPFGVARQTPMLVNRVQALGPYGWQGESPTLIERIKAGFALHRRFAFPSDGQTMRMRAQPLARFLREGLVPPPHRAAKLTVLEEEGKRIFHSPQTKCVSCHDPKKEYTNRHVTPLPGFRTLRFFSTDEKPAFKVPSLFYVGNTEPYYHDGSAGTLEELVANNGDRMGKTSHLSEQERAALVAFLKTL